MKIHYLEVVTPEVGAVCAGYAAAHTVTFAEQEPAPGGARTAAMPARGREGAS
ncbi:MAG TPA: hypothetical protein VLA43_10165 [Longimicrobiales bacterium]|nr:hypothetical protein [Longimicrobiales bacterium]